MTIARITADAALDFLVDEIESVTLSTKSRADTRNKFRAIDMTDISGGVTHGKSRVFGYYILSQGPSEWCFGGESIEAHIKIAYQNEIIYQDLVELKNHLEYNMTKKDGIAGFYTQPTFIENNDIGESLIYVYMPISIDYKPPRLQNES